MVTKNDYVKAQATLITEIFFCLFVSPVGRYRVEHKIGLTVMQKAD